MLIQHLKTSAALCCTVLALMITSCHHDPIEVNESEIENFIGMIFDDEDEFDDDEEYDEICFGFIYPLTVDFPDTDTQVFDDETSLWDALEDWYENSAVADSLDPDIVFPVEVELDNGDILTLTNDEELVDLFYECYDSGYDDYDICEYDDDFFTDLSDCYEIQFPIQFQVDTTIYTIEHIEDVDSVLYTIYLSEDLSDYDIDIELIYPIRVVDLSTDEITVVESDEEIEALFYACDILSLCFTFNYPITLIDAEGNTQEINSDIELIDAYVQFDLNNDDDSALLPVFPLTVTLDDGTELTKDNLEDLESLYETCD